MFRWVITAGLSLTATLLMPLHAGAMDNRLVEELIVKSGIRQQIEQIPINVREGLRQEQGRLQDFENKMAKLDAAIDSSFNPKRMEVQLHDIIGKNLRVEDIREVLKWLDSPLGQKLTRMEEAAAEPAAKQEMALALQQLIKDPGAPQRLRLLQRVENALQSTDAAVDMVMNIQIAILSALSAMAPTQPRPSFEQLAELVYKNRQQVQQVISQQVISGFLYTYRDVSDQDLETYIEFIVSPIGSKYHKVTMQAFSDVMITCSKIFGKAVGELLTGKEPSSEI